MTPSHSPQSLPVLAHIHPFHFTYTFSQWPHSSYPAVPLRAVIFLSFGLNTGSSLHCKPQFSWHTSAQKLRQGPFTFFPFLYLCLPDTASTCVSSLHRRPRVLISQTEELMCSRSPACLLLERICVAATRELRLTYTATSSSQKTED